MKKLVALSSFLVVASLIVFLSFSNHAFVANAKKPVPTPTPTPTQIPTPTPTPIATRSATLR